MLNNIFIMCKSSHVHAGTQGTGNEPSSSNPDPPKRGRGGPRGSTKAAAAAASSAATSPTGPAGLPETEKRNGAALEPAGPVADNMHAQRRQRRGASGSQASGAVHAGADNTGTAEDGEGGAAVQSEEPKSRRGRSRASSSQLKQVGRKQNRA